MTKKEKNKILKFLKGVRIEYIETDTNPDEGTRSILIKGKVKTW